jgi:hypothetical protein
MYRNNFGGKYWAIVDPNFPDNSGMRITRGNVQLQLERRTAGWYLTNELEIMWRKASWYNLAV